MGKVVFQIACPCRVEMHPALAVDHQPVGQAEPPAFTPCQDRTQKRVLTAPQGCAVSAGQGLAPRGIGGLAPDHHRVMGAWQAKAGRDPCQIKDAANALDLGAPRQKPAIACKNPPRRGGGF